MTLLKSINICYICLYLATVSNNVIYNTFLTCRHALPEIVGSPTTVKIPYIFCIIYTITDTCHCSALRVLETRDRESPTTNGDYDTTSNGYHFPFIHLTYLIMVWRQVAGVTVTVTMGYDIAEAEGDRGPGRGTHVEDLLW